MADLSQGADVNLQATGNGAGALADILTWRSDCPADNALRRFCTKDDLNDDLDELTTLCKSKYGVPFAAEYVPDPELPRRRLISCPSTGWETLLLKDAAHLPRPPFGYLCSPKNNAVHAR